MARYHASIETPVPVEDAFDHLARFSTAESWDPGVERASMLTPEPVGLGSAFELHVRTGLGASAWRYEIVDYARPRLVRLRAEHRPFVSVDTITVEPRPGGSRITYDADLRLTGPFRILDPLLAVAFRRIGDRAVAGLRRAFDAAGATP